MVSLELSKHVTVGSRKRRGKLVFLLAVMLSVNLPKKHMCFVVGEL